MHQNLQITRSLQWLGNITPAETVVAKIRLLMLIAISLRSMVVRSLLFIAAPVFLNVWTRYGKSRAKNALLPAVFVVSKLVCLLYHVWVARYIARNVLRNKVLRTMNCSVNCLNYVFSVWTWFKTVSKFLLVAGQSKAYGCLRSCWLLRQ